MPAKIAKASTWMFDGLKNAFRDSIDWIIRGWNGLQFSIPGVNSHIPGVGTIGGLTLGTPDIPLLANGIITAGPMIAQIWRGLQGGSHLANPTLADAEPRAALWHLGRCPGGRCAPR